MGRKANSGEVNKSQAIRDILGQNPDMPVKEVVAALGEKGIEVKPNHVYIIKGKLSGPKSQRKARRRAVKVVKASAAGNSDAVATIVRVKKLAEEVGGLRNLRAIVDALSN